jgi:AICAR transformylase/IMP cyclohydrolase PurH
MRGINRQNIFEDDEDYERFIETLRSYKAISEYRGTVLLCSSFSHLKQYD